MELLRRRVNPESTAVRVFPVSHLPVERRELPGAKAAYSGLVEVALRAVDLQKFRNAKLERQMVELYSRLMPGGKALVVGEGAGGGRFVKAKLFPIEPGQAMDLNGAILKAGSRDERRRLIRQTVADGCRATLEAKMAAGEIQCLPGGATVSCQSVVDTHRKTHHFCLTTQASANGNGQTPAAGPGGRAGAVLGTPGLPEVCEACELGRGAAGAQRAYLRVKGKQYEQAAAAAEPGAGAVAGDAPAVAEPPGAGNPVWPWPRGAAAAPGRADADRPVVCLLLSGGVFRGVFQVGVVNALNELGLKPDLLAGSSVGSIVAAMVASVFDRPGVPDRQAQMAQPASTFLALDRLVLTDRLVDFVSRMALRAARADFSLADADEAFRQYDRPLSLSSRKWRRVVAGIERLFHVSPFELVDLLRAVRFQRLGDVAGLLRAYAQEVLDRNGVGTEALGAEPLALLILERVIAPHLRRRLAAGEIAGAAVRFDTFLRSGMWLLATATDLTRGRLEILGDPAARKTPMLVDALLASSAFPGVFRPRWSSEVFPGSGGTGQYVDGGVMDNLPLDAVANFLVQSARKGLVLRRPDRAPHLLLTASLEVDPCPLTAGEASAVARNWPRLRRRASQRDLRELYELHGRRGGPALDPDRVPLNLEVVTVKPKWLCGTFAFHPMLGFSRDRQAASIAHGCAATFKELRNYAANATEPRRVHWLKEWLPFSQAGFDNDALDGLNGPPRAGQKAHGTSKGKLPGGCHFRKGAVCPFSRAASDQRGEATLEATKEALDQIYTACGRPETHQPEGARPTAASGRA